MFVCFISMTESQQMKAMCLNTFVSASDVSHESHVMPSRTASEISDTNERFNTWCRGRMAKQILWYNNLYTLSKLDHLRIKTLRTKSCGVVRHHCVKFKKCNVMTVTALQLVENDPKALFRRCQAYDALGKVEEAYKDVMTLMKVDPKNKAVAAIYQKLNPIMQEKVRDYANWLHKKYVLRLLLFCCCCCSHLFH